MHWGWFRVKDMWRGYTCHPQVTLRLFCSLVLFFFSKIQILVNLNCDFYPAISPPQWQIKNSSICFVPLFYVLIALRSMGMSRKEHIGEKSAFESSDFFPLPCPETSSISSHLSKCKSAIKTQTAKCQRWPEAQSNWQTSPDKSTGNL